MKAIHSLSFFLLLFFNALTLLSKKNSSDSLDSKQSSWTTQLELVIGALEKYMFSSCTSHSPWDALFVSLC